MKKFVSMVLCLILVMALAVPAFATGITPEVNGPAVSNERDARIINGPVNLRRAPKLDPSNVLCLLKTGTDVVVEDENCAFADNYWWSYIYVPGNASGYQYGYVATNYLSW